MTATISGPQKNFYLNNEEKVKETLSKPTDSDQPCWTLKKGEYGYEKVRQEQNFETEQRICRGRSFPEGGFEIESG